MNQWSTEKPDYPCLFVARRSWKPDEVFYSLYELKLDANEKYLAVLEDGNKWGMLDDLEADEYFVIERYDEEVV